MILISGDEARREWNTVTGEDSQERQRRWQGPQQERNHGQFHQEKAV